MAPPARCLEWGKKTKSQNGRCRCRCRCRKGKSPSAAIAAPRALLDYCLGSPGLCDLVIAMR
ncbi:hypothetical protein MAPG_06114 [Magnaporthiopsis poae ATCC 64411]|uniref:Uncharacterized protein n=1 Tax=Magnaporthiopsis poae (strain ATCC 64411 / 73-15) TaxID=644358 RepID=A0A0C4E165_MAGP6|nr:hypothetical protein MAPG_06114 [Magnaporthiopsis poae ATCC 64411]